MDVSMGSDEFFAGVKDKLVVSGAEGRDWRQLHRICMTDTTFKNREQIAHGYLDAIMVLSYDKKPEVAGAAPITTWKRTEDKLMIRYRYAPNQLDVSQDTMEKAMKNDKYVKNE